MTVSKTTREWSNLKITDPTDLTYIDFKNDEQLIKKLGCSNIVKIVELKNHIEIQTYAYVGRLRIGNLELTINPKLDDLPFLRLLDYTFELGILKHFPETYQSLGLQGFLELLLYALSAEIQSIVRTGLFRNYIPVHQKLNNIKGQIDFNQFIKSMSAFSLDIPCRYFDRNENNLLNQVLLAGGRYAHTISRNSVIRNSLSKNLGLVHNEVRMVELNKQLIHSACSQINRLNNNYTKALKLIGLIYNSSGVLFDDSDEQLMLDGFLLNMNSLFQKFITKILLELLVGYKILSEKNIPDFFCFLPEYNPKNKRNPLPRPDITLVKNNASVMFLDAKYIDLWENEIPSSILYQLSIYVLSLNIPNSKAIILYPTLSEEATDSVLEIKNPFNSLIKSFVVIRPVKILYLLEVIEENNLLKCSQFVQDLVNDSFDAVGN